MKQVYARIAVIGSILSKRVKVAEVAVALLICVV